MTAADSKKSSGLPLHHHPRGFALLRLIGVFKLVKSVALIAASIWVLHLRHIDIENRMLVWAHFFHIAPGNRYLQNFLVRLLAVSSREWEVLAGIFAAYALMFMVEGIGLLMMKYWAEWMTIITTSALIPLEVFEMIHRPGIGKAITLVINAAVAIYLAMRLWREHQAHEKAMAGGIKPN
jgi:uncharacterized membrane protein (DUF2068 family)